MVHFPLVLSATLFLTLAALITGQDIPVWLAFCLVFSGVCASAFTSSWRVSRRLTPEGLAWALAFLVSAGLVIGHDRLSADAPATEVAAAMTEVREVELERAWDGHFRAVAQVNGAPVGFLIDTGASLVLLRHDDAERIGFNLEALDFSIPVTTANGRSYVAPVTFSTIRIVEVELHDVRGAVAEAGKLHSSLLGMSFLEGLYETTIRGDRIIMRR